MTFKTSLLGLGPTLAASGVSGVLATPHLELYSGSTMIDTVDAWGATYPVAAMRSLFHRLGASDLSVGTADTVDVIDLTGSRTVMIKSTNGETGVALAEVFLVLP